MLAVVTKDRQIVQAVEKRVVTERGQRNDTGKLIRMPSSNRHHRAATRRVTAQENAIIIDRVVPFHCRNRRCDIRIG